MFTPVNSVAYKRRQKRELGIILLLITFCVAMTAYPIGCELHREHKRRQFEQNKVLGQQLVLRYADSYLDHTSHRSGICPDWHLNDTAVQNVLSKAKAIRGAR